MAVARVVVFLIVPLVAVVAATRRVALVLVFVAGFSRAFCDVSPSSVDCLRVPRREAAPI